MDFWIGNTPTISNSGELGCPSRKRTESILHWRYRSWFSTDTTWLLLCNYAQGVFEKSLMYLEVPTVYIWTKQKSWIRQKQGKTFQGHEVKASDTIRPVVTVHSQNKECFYLQIFLHTIRGPTNLRISDDFLVEFLQHTKKHVDYMAF